MKNSDRVSKTAYCPCEQLLLLGAAFSTACVIAPHRTGIVVLNSMQVASIPLEVGDCGN